MRNSLRQSWKEPVSGPGWSVDTAPRARLGMLYFVFLLPVMLIAMRLVWLQVVIPGRFLATWNSTVESYETLPATDGRILSSDGQVLAYDQPRYAIHVHYRWLEEPVNADWLQARSRERLPRSERKDRRRMAESQAQILQERDALWKSLADLTGRSPHSLLQLRQSIQLKTQAMAQSVNARREAQSTTRTASPLESSTLQRLWLELSTTPDRTASRPLVIREELETHELLDDVSIAQISTIQSHPSRFPGVEIRGSSERVYPQGEIAAHIIGLRSPVEAPEITQRASRFSQGDPLALEVGDLYGKTGIERAYDNRLRGIRGLRRVVRNHAGEIIEQDVVRPSRNGVDVMLTIDASLQQQAEQLLDDVLAGHSSDDSTQVTPDGTSETVVPSAGAIVVLDLQSGETLIAASSPRYDLTAMQHPSKEQWSRWTNDSRHPLISRVTQATVPPGSIFQVVTAIAGLEQGILSPEETFQCQGYLKNPQHDRCFVYQQFGKGHGSVNLSLALSQSCNVYFFDLANRLGPQPIETWAHRLGFGSPTGIDMGGERAGNVPTRSVPGKHNRWSPGTTRQFAIGQADLTVTPLQVAQLMAIIGNGGRRITPRLTSGQTESLLPGNSANQFQLVSGVNSPPAPERLLSDRTLQSIREGLEMTVEHPQGTGRQAQVPGLLVAGKTGIAMVSGDKPDHAWFAGYVPADRPRYAFAVFLEHGGSGCKTTAPLARQVMMSMVEADLLSPHQ